MQQLPDEVKYQAVVENERRYDGVFFYAVKTTGIVCRPSCKSKVPNRDNVVFFDKVEDALRQGYRACKRCQPDLELGYMPEAELIEKACDIIKQDYDKPGLLRELPSRIGISPSHFQRIFKKIVGQTPKEYIQKHKVVKAAELLDGVAMSSLEVSLAAGFASLSAFYAAFRAETGCSPKEYRNGQGCKRSLP